MKKRTSRHSSLILILSACLFLFLTESVHGQRYLPRMGGITLSSGITEKLGFYVDAGYSTYTKRKHHWNFGLNYLMNRDAYPTGKLPLSQLTGEGGFYLKLFQDPRRTFYGAIGLEGIFGYEWINWGCYALPDGGRIQDRSRFVYGGAIGLELEYYLNDRYVLLLRVREKCLAGSEVGIWHTEAGLGLKIMIR